MTSGEIAALITACGVSLAAILTAIAALINARNSKDIVERLRNALQEARQEIAALQEHNIHQDRLLVDREVELGQVKRENSKMDVKIALWQEWGETVGRDMNKMQLTIGYLTQHQKPGDPTDTLPLPTSVDPKR